MPRAQRRKGNQEGHLMAGLMAAVAILMIFSTMAFQSWSEVLRRDNEAEMMFRAQDIVRAIQRYRRDHGGMGPQKLEDLMEPGPKRQYYLRQMWTDPLVKDGKWGLLYFGPGGALIDPSTETEGGIGLPGQTFGGQSGSRLNPPSGVGQSGGRSARGGQRGGAGQPAAGQLGGVGNRGTAGGTEGTGLPIAGVKSLCEETPFRVYNGYTEYRDWLFSVLDLENQQVPGGGRPGQSGPGGLGRGPGQGRGPGRGPGTGPGTAPGSVPGTRPGPTDIIPPPGRPPSNLTPRDRDRR